MEHKIVALCDAHLALLDERDAAVDALLSKGYRKSCDIPQERGSMMDEAAIAEYQSAIVTVVTCARLLATHDIPALLAAIETADSVGPILDPTMWRAKKPAMDEDKQMLQAALPLWRLAELLHARADAIEKGEA
jgi:hypothetical protein